MSQATKRKLSGSTDGKPIKIVQTSTLGNTIHTAITGTTAGTYDEVWLWACNVHTDDVVLTIEFGGTAVDQNIIVTIPSKTGLKTLVPGLILQNGAVVTAFAATTNVVMISGFVNRITD